MTKTKKLFKHLPLVIATFAIGLGVFVSAAASRKNDAVVTFATYTNGDGATYYNSISDSLTGDSLLSALRSLNSSKRSSTVGYSSMGTSPSGQFKYTDYDTNYVKHDSNGQPYGEKIISFYSGNSTSSFNREHVWPNSHGGNAVEADIHMPRPTIASENGSRGNSFYVEGKCSSTAGWDPAMESFGDETYRGDSARIIFYCMVCDSKFQLIEADSHSTSNSNKDYMMGRLSDLIKWNINYPVLDREQRRNEGAEYLQGNRNPFIDHPEYACKIWGNANSTTQNLCSNASFPTVSHSAGIRTYINSSVSSANVSAYTLKIGESVTLLPFVDGTFNSSVSWNVSDSGITSYETYSGGGYSNGRTLTGVKEGTSTVTLSYSYDDNGTAKTATAQTIITVVSSGSSGEGTSGTADNVENITSATYTVTSNTSVSNSGTVPSASSASYSQTYTSKGQITKGNKATLTLSGYSGKVITGITLNMKSNGSSGSGSFSATAGTTYLASTSGSFDTWYDNTSYGTAWRDVKVDLTNSSRIIGSGEDVTLTIAASANSLYINSYKITYGTPSEGGSTPEPEVPVLESISASGMTQNYLVGDTFSFDGILKATYSDGNEENVIPDSVSSPNMSTPGNKVITLTYEDGGVEKSTSYTIYVTEAPKVLNGISIENAPNKTQYTEGDKFDPTGLVIRRTYTDSTHDTYTYSGHSSEFSFNPSLNTVLTTSNKTITITYDGKSTSQLITVSAAPFNNTIKDLYSKSQGSLSGNTFYGMYMGYTIHMNKSKTRTYYDLFLGNGDFAILLYGCYESLPDFTPFETGLSVTGGYLNIYNNLYANYNGSTQYSTTITALTSSQISELIAPVSTYVITGEENGSNASDQKTASRLATLSGTVKSVGGTINSENDVTVVVTLQNGNDANVFVKGKAGLNYSKLATELTNGNDVYLRGFTSVYSTSYQLVSPVIIEASSTYGYEDFAQDLLDLTDSICASSESKEASLSAVWVNLEVNKFSILSDEAQLTLQSYGANKDSSDITAQAMARYDQICKKYASCNNFIGRTTANYAAAPYQLHANTNQTSSIVIFVCVALVSITSLTILLVIKKRKSIQ